MDASPERKKPRKQGEEEKKETSSDTENLNTKMSIYQSSPSEHLSDRPYLKCIRIFKLWKANNSF